MTVRLTIKSCHHPGAGGPPANTFCKPLEVKVWNFAAINFTSTKPNSQEPRQTVGTRSSCKKRVSQWVQGNFKVSMAPCFDMGSPRRYKFENITRMVPKHSSINVKLFAGVQVQGRKCPDAFPKVSDWH